jgi:DNA polymerase I-like protein with 3'-5' exonuclease and polymerase domains
MLDKIIETNAEAMSLLQKISAGQIWAFDLETNSLNVRSGLITDIALYDGKTAYNIVHRKWNGAELEEVVSKQVCTLILNKLKKCRLRTWNGSFDTRFVYHYFGVNLIESIWEDGMLKAHLVNENRFSYGLKEIAADIYGENATAEKTDMLQSIKANGGTAKQYFMADSNIRAKYAIQDVKLTYSLCEHFQEQLATDGLEEFYQLETIELYRHVTIYAELYGIPVDIPFMQKTQVELAEILVNLEEQIQAEIAPLLGSFNKWYMTKNYPFELNARFKQKLGEFIAPELWPRSDSGKLSFNVADLKRAKELTKTEIKKGIIRPLLQESEFENYISGKVRVPAELIHKVQRALLAEDGVKHIFNLSSKDHLKRLFFGSSTVESALNETPISRTDKGQAQVDDAFLTAISSKYGWVKKLQRLNSLNKIKSTYVDRFLEEQEDGIFYPSFMLHRTTSGRLSSNFQQLPRPIDEKEAKEQNIDEAIVEYTNRIRRFFISGSEKSFVDLDYDSQEVKVFAHVSGEQRIKDIFENGDDFYSSVCIASEGLTEYSANKKAENYLGKLNKAARQRAKAYALGLAFNMSPYKLKFELNCSEEEAKKIYNSYFNAYPNLKKWLDNSIKKACIEGKMVTEAGRIRHYPELQDYYKKYGDLLFDGLELWKEYHDYPEMYQQAKTAAGICKNLVNNAANFQIQGLAASITNRAAIKAAKEIKNRGLNAYICALVHDQITILCEDSCLQETLDMLQWAMETAYEISVKLTAPPSHGKNLAESK